MKVRKDEKEVYEHVSLHPEDKDRHYLHLEYRFKRINALETKAGFYIPDEEFPSDSFWGRLEKQIGDKKYFEEIDWGKVEPRTKNKLNTRVDSWPLGNPQTSSPSTRSPPK